MLGIILISLATTVWVVLFLTAVFGSIADVARLPTSASAPVVAGAADVPRQLYEEGQGEPARPKKEDTGYQNNSVNWCRTILSRGKATATPQVAGRLRANK